MEIQLLPESLPPLSLPPYTTQLIGRASTGTERFELYLNLDHALVAKLQERSRDASDSDLRANTSDYERFVSDSYDAWYAKGRLPFALVDETNGALAAITWYGPKPLGRKSLKYLSEIERANETTAQQQSPENWHTVVFRSYPPYRGKGLMRDFVTATEHIYRTYVPEAKLWVGINRKNSASIALATKLGYVLDEHHSDSEWVAMIKA